MSDVKEFNNDELEKVTGGENADSTRFAAGDWIKDFSSSIRNNCETVYYIKEVINDAYNLIQYEHFVNENAGKRYSLSKCEKRELYNQSYKYYRYPMYHKIDKPSWIKE